MADSHDAPACGPQSDAPRSAASPEAGVWTRSFPGPSLAFTFAFLALALTPRVRGNANLLATFAGIGAVFIGWQAWLWLRARRSGRVVRVEFAPIRAHWVQALVQLCIYAYWAWYWPNVVPEIPLIAAQILFLYALTALFSWTRGRTWQLGFGPLPIVLSTNLFLWFRDDVFVFQFLMVATGALGKEFIRWKRDGRETHVFNPSVLGVSLFSLVLIFTGSTHHTWGEEIAATLATPPHIYKELFLLGLVVQLLFSVTLMTLAAAATLCALNLLFTWSTGTYHFLDTGIPIAVFLGFHLLVTDPATSPRTNVGRMIFGSLYALATFILYGVLLRAAVPEFYDKLLPVPLLNLSVPLLDRIARLGILGRFTRWEAHFAPSRANLVYMGCWSALFVTMLATNFIEGRHPGSSISFWKQAYEQGKPDAGRKLYKVVGAKAAGGSAVACNELGLIYMEGELIAADRGAAAYYFARACELGDDRGCTNVAIQRLYLGEAASNDSVAHALARLERRCTDAGDARACSLVALAHAIGAGRPVSKQRALELYRRACERGEIEACKALARNGIPAEPVEAALVLEAACAEGDAEACLLLAVDRLRAHGPTRDELQARSFLERARELGSPEAAAALETDGLSSLSLPRRRQPPAWAREVAFVHR